MVLDFMITRSSMGRNDGKNKWLVADNMVLLYLCIVCLTVI